MAQSPPLDPPNALLYIDQKQYNILNILDILESPRKSTCFYISVAVAEAFRIYARRHPSYGVADCLENALMEYMRNNPLKDMLLNIGLVEDIRGRGVNNRVEEKILVDKITRILKIIDRFKKRGSDNHLQYISDLHDLLLRAVKLRSPSEVMVALLGRAEAYI